MAEVRMPDGRVFDVADNDATLLDYYRGEGAEVVLDHERAVAAAELAAFVTSSTVPEVLDRVAAEPDIAGQVLAVEQQRGDDARVTLLEALQGQVEQGEVEIVATGERMTGVLMPQAADEISNNGD